MSVPIFSAAGVTITLTKESASSGRGIPVLRLESDGQRVGDFGAADALPGLEGSNGNRHIVVTAAAVVCSWAREPDRTPEELRAAHQFLRTWPNGPQLY